jgi:hypothetical protein
LNLEYVKNFDKSFGKGEAKDSKMKNILKLDLTEIKMQLNKEQQNG